MYSIIIINISGRPGRSPPSPSLFPLKKKYSKSETCKSIRVKFSINYVCH